MHEISLPTPAKRQLVPPPKMVTVAVHDVAPSTMTSCQRLLDAIAEVANLPVSLLVVPRYHGAASDPVFERWLDRALVRGDELVLHGFTHCDDGIPRNWVDRVRRRWYTAGEGEFSALGEEEARRRLEKGRRWFAANGWPLQGFVAPAWLMSTGTRRALASEGFAYTATVSRLIQLPSGRDVMSQSIVYSTRSPWRRAISLAWNGAVAQTLRNACLLRFELHPADVEYPRIRASWMHFLRTASVGRQTMTIASAVESIPEAVWRNPSL